MRDPSDLSPEERFRELAELFARGILRSRGKRVPPESPAPLAAENAMRQTSAPPTSLLESRVPDGRPAQRRKRSGFLSAP